MTKDNGIELKKKLKKECLKNFHVYLLENEKSTLTIEKYLRDVSYFLVWLEERELTKAEVLAYKAQIIDAYAVSSVNSMLSSINCYLKFVGKGDCCVKILKMQREVFCSEERELSQEEYKRLLQAAKEDRRLALLMQTIAATGIRISEHKYITVEAIRQGWTKVDCKGKVRKVIIPQKLCKLLLKYARSKHIIKGSIFIGKKGKPLDRSRIWAQMKGLCEKAGVLAKKVFPHNLRHLFARTFYAMEKDVVRLADILGHSNVNTTRIYTAESGSVHRRMIEKMPLLYIT